MPWEDGHVWSSVCPKPPLASMGSGRTAPQDCVSSVTEPTSPDHCQSHRRVTLSSPLCLLSYPGQCASAASRPTPVQPFPASAASPRPGRSPGPAQFTSSIHPPSPCLSDCHLPKSDPHFRFQPLPPSPLSHLPASKWLPQPPHGHSSPSRIAPFNSNILMSSTCIKLLRAPCSESGSHIQTPWPGVTNPFPSGSFFLSRLAWHHLLRGALHAYPGSGAPQMPGPYSPLPLPLPALCP